MEIVPQRRVFELILISQRSQPIIFWLSGRQQITRWMQSINLKTHLSGYLLSTIVISHLLTVLYSTVLIDDEESTMRAFHLLSRLLLDILHLFYYTSLLLSVVWKGFSSIIQYTLFSCVVERVEYYTQVWCDKDENVLHSVFASHTACEVKI